MTRKTLCIVIALMVLSVGAIIGANPSILGEFSSTLNGVPVQVTISRQDNGTITTTRPEDLLENWKDYDYDGRFVRFMGIVTSVDWLGPKAVRLGLDEEGVLGEKDSGSLTLSVHSLDAPHLPTKYQEGHVYEFTGFLIHDIPTIVIPNGPVDHVLRIYAFEIRHHGSLSAADQAAEYLERD